MVAATAKRVGKRSELLKLRSSEEPHGVRPLCPKEEVLLGPCCLWVHRRIPRVGGPYM